MTLFILKGEDMARRLMIEPIEKDKTTIVTDKLLLDRVGIHVKKSGDNQTDFITRALINQLEREGDFTIRQDLMEERNDY
jgi:hypothetical protein